MDFDLDADQRRWLAQVRQFLHDSVTDELLRERALHGSEDPGPATIEFRRKMGERGWFGVSWPQEYGGSGWDPSTSTFS